MNEPLNCPLCGERTVPRPRSGHERPDACACQNEKCRRVFKILPDDTLELEARFDPDWKQATADDKY